MPKSPKRKDPDADPCDDEENRHGQVRRFFDILTLLEHHPRGLTVKKINEKLNPDDLEHKKKRNLFRDLKYLRSMFPLETVENDSANEGGQLWRFKKNANTRDAVILSPKETLALYLARQVLLPLRATPFVQDLEALFKKIDARLGARNRERLEELRKEISFEPGPAWGLGGLSEDLLKTAQRALFEGQVLSCIYSSANSQTVRTRKLGPIYVRYSKGALYLRAEDLEDGQIKTFDLSRMKDVEMTDDAYDAPKVDPEKDFENCFGLFKGANGPEDIVIQFAQEISPYIRGRSWHSSQEVVNLAGGKAELRLHVEVTVELVGWVMMFGPKAQVLGPKSLIDQVKAAAAGVLENYERKVKKAG